MAEAEQPQIYLVTPADLDLGSFPDQLSGVLDVVEVACVRIAMASTDADHVARSCDAIRQVAHARDVPVVVADHAGLVERLGLDGVHLSDGAKSVRKLRKDFGREAIIGAFCGSSRHDGLNAGEGGADYVAFGPVRATELGHASPADFDLFAWWSEMIEVPIVAEGAFDIDAARKFAPVCDFIALGSEIWGSDDAIAMLRAYVQAIT